MLFSIIINTHNQHETIGRCLKSCLNQNFKNKYEIIIIDTSDKKINNKLINSPKVQYYHFKNFSKYPELNQLRKVYEGCRKAKGRWFCLLDGDDIFKNNKLKNINKKYKLSEKILLQDECQNYNEFKKTKNKHTHKGYKRWFLYKTIINFWPEIYGTSSLSGNINILKSFFKEVSLKKWNLLAIDALLVLYCLNKNQFFFNNAILTIKSIGSNNLGKKYTIMSKKFWIRRNQQITYWEFISKKKIYNIDKVICRFIKIIF
jgi:glycosyltransferase involved in cell wall biosynthesis